MDYQKQAQDLADKLGIKLIVKYKDYGKHFAGDNQARHIFRCTLKRGRKSYTFDFGQSIAAGAQEPTMHDVLTCLTKYDPESFTDFCEAYGYEEFDYDVYNGLNKQSMKVYKAVVKEWEAMNRLFTDEELELLQEINQ